MATAYFYSYEVIAMLSGFEVSVDVVALVTIGVAAITLTYKKVVKPSFIWSKSIIDSLGKIDAIHEQMFTNGGKTLRDAVNRIENRITLLEKQQNIYIMDTPHGVFNSNKDGRFTTVNRTLCRMTGKTEGELLGNGWINSVSERDRERVVDSWKYAIENEIEFSTSFDITDTDGFQFRVRCTANPMKSADGKLLGYLGIIDSNG